MNNQNTKFSILNQIKQKAFQCGISSNEVNFAKSLVDNKNKDPDVFVCEGLWAANKLIDNNFEVLMFLFNGENLENQNDQNLKLILKMANYAKQSFSLSQKACKKISDRDGFDEFFIIAKLKTYTTKIIENAIKGKTNILAMVMDGLEQPGNIGAILRSFDCAGGDFAIITNKQAKLTNSRLVRASLGASFLVPCLELNINEAQTWLQENNFKCVVTDLQATKSFKNEDYGGRIAIVAGNEHTGISPSWRSLKNSQSVIIPMLGSCESLNVGFASTLVAYEAGLKKFSSGKTKLKF